MTDGERHAAAGVSVPVPAGWSPTTPMTGTVLTVVEPARPGRFAANVVVGVDPAAAGSAAAAWMDQVVDALGEEIVRLRVVDVEDVTVADRPGRRLLAHYPAPDVGGITIEQWLVPDGDRGLVLTCSTTTLEFDDRTDVFAEVAAGLRVEVTP